MVTWCFKSFKEVHRYVSGLPRSEIAGAQGMQILNSISKRISTVVTMYTTTTRRQCPRGPIYLPSFVFSDFSIFANLMGVKWFFLCSLAVHISSSVKYLFMFVHFSTALPVSFRVDLY